VARSDQEPRVLMLKRKRRNAEVVVTGNRADGPCAGRMEALEIPQETVLYVLSTTTGISYVLTLGA